MSLNHRFLVAGQPLTSHAPTDDDLALDVLKELESTGAKHVTLYVEGSSASMEDDASVDFASFTASLITHAAGRNNFYLGSPVGNPNNGFFNGVEFEDQANACLVFEKGNITIKGVFSEDSNKVALDLDGVPGY